MNRRSIFTLTIMALLGLTVILPTGGAAAQQKKRETFKVSAENAKYPQVHYIDVGDVPGHQVGVSELHRVFPNNGPDINGVKVNESWTRTLADFTDYNGLSNNYTMYVIENGDKFFERGSTMGDNNG